MKILVAVKRVIDANVKARVLADHSGIDLTNVKMAMNPFCEIAVEAAVRLKEQGQANEIVAVSIGPDKAQEQIRNAMALGADRGLLVQTEQDLEPLNIAKLLKAIVEKEQPDLVILGKQSIDSDNNQVGQMLAALCNYPQGTFAFSLELEDKRIVVGREVDGGEQTVSLSLPAVVTTDLRLNEPRYAKLPEIMKARKKPLEILAADTLGVDTRKHLVTLSVNEPPQRTAGVQVASAEELISKLRNEARIIP